MKKKAIRINTLKIEIDKLIKNLEDKGYILEKINYCDYGFFVNENGRNIAHEIEHWLGYFFIQDASSMLIPIILDAKKDDLILDLCAAPGAKTTQIAQMMENNGCIVANDVREDRIKALSFNLERCGVLNTIVTMLDGVKFLKKCNIKFNKILLDVPCSGTGVYEDVKITENQIKRLTTLQKALLKNSFNCLDKDGYVVYSTCSILKEENEDVIEYCIKKFGLETVEIKNFERYNLKESFLENTYRLEQPYQEKFFVCKLMK
ncbi:MAG: RsmB/NOP family class I SAM-dependent RNA methyltransferase [Candidatus Aenigmarchaeota archaeon]|nr:RsmB/NOP family class I SAM-dependent RNA methyltransferase [Candidatus Aenigmarchaeota archaeon]MDW8149501.1 RsmB/NOP family class I SAM-dependent RNA methyltransferase [Candidatus Aenigmarchaeota archaeon]